MKHTLHYDDQHQLVVQTIIGLFTTDEAKQMGKSYIDLVKGKPFRQIIVDLRVAGKMENRETRSIANDMLNAAQFSDVAFVGATAAQRMIAKVLMKLGSLKADSNFVKDMEEAYNWLEKRRK